MGLTIAQLHKWEEYRQLSKTGLQKRSAGLLRLGGNGLELGA